MAHHLIVGSAAYVPPGWASSRPRVPHRIMNLHQSAVFLSPLMPAEQVALQWRKGGAGLTMVFQKILTESDLNW